MSRSRSTSAKLVAAALSLLVPGTLAAQTTLTIPAGTFIYGELDEQVTSRKRDTAVGDVVRVRVWRDVIVGGQVLVKAGTPLMTRVSHVKPAKIAGRKGEVFLEAISTQAVDGSEVLLDGGYDKSGKGRKAVAWSLFALVAWPLVFIKGKHAILDPGTVFDASLQADAAVAVAVDESAAPAFPIRMEAADLAVEVLYDDMDPDAKQKLLPLRLTACGFEVESAAVATVNEKAITRIPIQLGERTPAEECVDIQATMDLEALAQHFTKGINRFTVESGEAVGEVILEIEL